jgi:integrase
MANKRRRAHGEGSIIKLGEQNYRGFVSVMLPNGKQKKIWRRGKSRRIVVQKLNELRRQPEHMLKYESEQVKLADYLRKHIDELRPERKPRTLQSYQDMLKYIDPALGNVPLTKVTVAKVEAFYQDLRDRGLANSTIKHVHHFLRQAFKKARRRKYIVENPLEDVETPKGKPPADRNALTAEQVVALLDACEGDRLEYLFYMLLTTGIRIGEARALRWQDWQEDRLHIRHTLVDERPGFSFGTPKTKGSERVLYLTDEQQRVLSKQAYLQKLIRETSKQWHDYRLVFATSSGKPLQRSNIARSLDRLTKRAGVPRMAVHELRHTYTSLALQQGVPSKVLATRLGHSDTTMTMKVYAHAYESDLRRAALSLGELTQDAATNQPQPQTNPATNHATVEGDNT